MVVASSSSPRRFNIDSSNQPIFQFIATTIPFAVLCLWFLYSTARRPYVDCYEPLVDGVTDADTAGQYSENCSQYVPLKQFALVFLILTYLWGLLVAYLLLYVPRRHQLVREYLTHGTTVIGDVYFNRHRKGGLLARLSTQQPAYGYAVYPSPHQVGGGGGGSNTTTSSTTRMVRRQVRVFERYTRERVAFVLLPHHPYSGQPKVDLEIDRDVTDLNHHRLRLLSRYAIAWLLFCLVAPIMIVETIRQLDHQTDDPPPWQPDIDLQNFPTWYYLASFVVMPVIVLLWTLVMWWWHRRWMTYQHHVISSDGSNTQINNKAGHGGDFNYYEQTDNSGDNHNPCCFDDEDCESIEIKDYQPPKANVVTRDKPMKDQQCQQGATV